MIGWLIALGVIILLGFLPVGICAVYGENGASVKLIFGPVRVLLYPRKPKGQKKPRQKKEPDEVLKPATGKKAGGKLADFLPLVDVVLEFLKDFHRCLRVQFLEMKLLLAGGDPSSLAINYGRAWAALGNLLPIVEQLITIRKRDLDISCDFVEKETKIYVRADLTLRLGSLLRIALWRGLRILFKYYEITNKRKGGANV